METLRQQIKQTIQEAFKDVIFDEEYHTYKSNNRILPSVSSKVKSHYNEFPAKKMAEICAINYNKDHNDKRSAKDFLTEWKNKSKTSLTKGTKIHKFAAKYPDFPEPAIDEQYAIIDWYNKLHDRYQVVLLEFPLYSDTYAGTPDKILLDTQTNNLIISDWKSGGDLFKNYKNQRLKSPFEGLLDNPFNRYSIQQSLYKILLEAKTPYKVQECWLIHLRDKEFTNHIALDLSKQLKEYDERTVCHIL